MDARKRDQERAAADKKASEEQARKQQLAQDCERSRGYLRALEDGLRIARTDAQGNQVVLDDAARADELARVRARMASNCN
jgi:DNA transposition AAA+ family ATPase